MTSTELSSPPPAGEWPPGWGQSLSRGAPGIALVHIERTIAGTACWDIVHTWATAMAREPVIAHQDTCSLYQGAPAVAFALASASHHAYNRALDTLDTAISTLIRRRLDDAHQRIDQGHLPEMREYDLISGLTGLGVYVLHRDRDRDLLQSVLAYLVRITQPLMVDGEALPGWWCHHSPDGRPSRHWREGHANLGMAHGIAGPLALLATAAKRGTTAPGQLEAIDRICHFLDLWRCGPGSASWWPGTVSITEWRTRRIRQPGPQRPSWCYGTPGVARAQQLAGQALRDQPRRKLAARSLANCIRDDRQLAQLVDASLCHGWAGLLQAVWRTAADGDEEDTGLLFQLPTLQARMDQHLARHGEPNQDGLLEGRAGVTLARLTATAGRPATSWDTCLLLAG